MSYYNLISLMPKTPAFVGLLDTYSGAAAAYSLRKLRSAYSGNCIRVRRSSDDTSQDFGFVNNVLDTNSLIDFIGYNTWNYSENLAQSSAYTLTNISISTDATVAPDSLNTADKIVENISSGFHRIHKNANISSGTTYNASVYIKASERTKVQISSALETADNNTAKSCDFDLTTGQITNSTFTTPSPIVTDVGNGWWRFSITQTATASGTAFGIRISLMNASGSINYTGNGTSGAFAWGFQLSQTSDVKTYQKTQADVNRNGFVTTWYDQSGNAKDTTQTTAINQPRIVNLGTLDVVNGKPAVLADGVNDNLTNTTLSLTNPTSIFTVVDKVGSGGNFGLTIGGSVAGGFILSPTGYGIYQNGPSFSPQYSNNNQSLLVYKTSSTGTNWEFYGNDTTVTNGGQNIGTLLGSDLSLFDRGGTTSRANMYMQEFIIWGNNQMTNRLGIQTNINSFYSIY